MVSKPLVLGFDTSAAHCAAALLRGSEIIASTAQDMTRGQAENLMPILESLLDETDLSWSDLDAIGVGVGPGNFTGIRISVSAARGLALGLSIPAIGVTTFDAIRVGQQDPVVAVVPAPRDHVYVSDPNTAEGPRLVALPYESPLRQMSSPNAKRLAENIAFIAAEKRNHTVPPPAPFYLRAADAAPPRDLPPKILL